MKMNFIRIFTVFFLAAFICTPAFSQDTLNLPSESLNGKFESVSDGLIIINQKGVTKSYTRTDNSADKYTDYITYRVSVFSKETASIMCKVIFLDKYLVKIKVPNSNGIEIPRYRVEDLQINIK